MEGGARARLIKHPGRSEYVRAGQMLNVKAGATRLPKPVNVDLRRIMRTNPLIADFPPLPSQNLILAVIHDQENGGPRGQPVYPGRPPNRRPPINRPPPRGVTSGGTAPFPNRGRRPTPRPGTVQSSSGSGRTVAKPKKTRKPRVRTTTSTRGQRGVPRRKPSPSPTPSIRIH
jgi:hypothetical protein